MTSTLHVALRCTACGRDWTLREEAMPDFTARGVAARLLREFCPDCHAGDPQVVRMRFVKLRDEPPPHIATGINPTGD